MLLGTAGEPLMRGVPAWPEGRRTGMIAGSRPVGLGLLAGRIEKPNDGTVAVSETRHPELDQHLTLPDPGWDLCDGRRQV